MIKTQQLFEQANQAYQQGQMDQAASLLEQIERTAEQLSIYTQAKFNLGEIYCQQNNFEQAIDAYCLIHREDNAAIYAKSQYNLGLIYRTLGKINEAKASFQKVLFLDDSETFFFAQVELKILGEPKERELRALSAVMRDILLELHINPEENLFEDGLSVAHYTRPSTAFSLLGLESEPSFFRLSTIQGVNDPKEGRVLYEYLGLIDLQENKDYATFVGCFTFNHDCLNQFRLYGKEQDREASGVSLVFDVAKFFNNNPEKLFDFVSKNLTTHNESKLSAALNKNTFLPLYRCIYMDPHNHYISIAKRMKVTFYRERGSEQAEKYWLAYQRKILQKEKQVKILLKKLTALLKKVRQKPSNHHRTYDALQLILRPLRYLVKHYAFEEEQECRMIDIHPLTTPDSRIKTDLVNKFMYVEYPINVKNAIQKVYLSVGAKQYETFFIRALGGSDKVHLSKNPFRQK